MPSDANDTVAQGFLSDFLLTGQDLPVTIHGDEASTPYGSLAVAMSHLVIASKITGLNHPAIVTQINAEITLESLVTNKINLDVDVRRSLLEVHNHRH